MTTPTTIIGAGMMGTAIAAAHLRCGLPVVLFDTAPTVLQTAPKRVEEELRLQNLPFDERLLTCTEKQDDIVRQKGEKRSVIIETITEKIKAKQKLYQKLLADRPPDFYLFSNTSTISISQLASTLPAAWQERFCGFHFFHPVRQRSLVEIIAGKNTTQATLDAAKEHSERIDKRHIQVGDAPGFLVNRILNPYLSSALTLLEQKVDLQTIERVALQFGMKMGPFRIMDEIGLDVVLHAGWVLHKAFPDRTPQSPILLKLVEEGKWGRKTGRGFMFYDKQASWDGEGTPDPLFASDTMLPDKEIIRKLFVPMYEEAIRCFEDGVISDLSTADTASIEALGFPDKQGEDTQGGIASWGAHFTAKNLTPLLFPPVS